MDNIQNKLQEVIKSETLAKALIEVSQSEPLVAQLLMNIDEKTFLNKTICTIILLANQNIEQFKTVAKLIKSMDPKLTKVEQT